MLGDDFNVCLTSSIDYLSELPVGFKLKSQYDPLSKNLGVIWNFRAVIFYEGFFSKFYVCENVK